MNNKEYIAALSQRSGYSQDTVKRLVRSTIDAMVSTFDEGEAVHVPSFGTFDLRRRMERIIVNPTTGQKMMVPPKIVLNFKPSSTIKEVLRNTETDNA